MRRQRQQKSARARYVRRVACTQGCASVILALPILAVVRFVWFSFPSVVARNLPFCTGAPAAAVSSRSFAVFPSSRPTITCFVLFASGVAVAGSGRCSSTAVVYWLKMATNGTLLRYCFDVDHYSELDCGV